MPNMTKQQKDNFLHNECVIMAAKYLDIIGTEPVFLDQLDALNIEIEKKSSDDAKELKNFQIVYDEWFSNIVENENAKISVKDIEIILKKDKAREALSNACIQYRKDNNLPEI